MKLDLSHYHFSGFIFFLCSQWLYCPKTLVFKNNSQGSVIRLEWQFSLKLYQLPCKRGFYKMFLLLGSCSNTWKVPPGRHLGGLLQICWYHTVFDFLVSTPVSNKVLLFSLRYFVIASEMYYSLFNDCVGNG